RVRGWSTRWSCWSARWEEDLDDGAGQPAGPFAVPSGLGGAGRLLGGRGRDAAVVPALGHGVRLGSRAPGRARALLPLVLGRADQPGLELRRPARRTRLGRPRRADLPGRAGGAPGADVRPAPARGPALRGRPARPGRRPR